MTWPWIGRKHHEDVRRLMLLEQESLATRLAYTQSRLGELEARERDVLAALVSFLERHPEPPAAAPKSAHEAEAAAAVDLSQVDPNDTAELLRIARRETGSVKASTLTQKVRKLRSEVIRAQQRRPGVAYVPADEEAEKHRVFQQIHRAIEEA